ncbi:MAG: prolipoprotein diacylglyceryl transferase [Myxococcota bacterium]
MISSSFPSSASLHTYGLMIALGFLVGMQLSAREAARLDLYRNTKFDQFVLDLIFGILIASMVGARTLFIIVEWDKGYAADPLKVFRIWEGGLVFYGGLIGGLLFSIYYSIKHGRDFFVVADTLVPQVALGQFFGRLGCLAAGCCWGEPLDPKHPLAIQFPAGSLVHSHQARSALIGYNDPYTVHIHPVQLYESFGTLTFFFVLLMVRTQKRFHGMVLATYLMGYAILRYVVETRRGDIGRGENVLNTPFSTSQLISLAMFSVGVGIIIVQWRKRQVATGTPQPSPAA